MADSIHFRLLEAVAHEIQQLCLDGIDDANITLLQVPDDKEQWLPSLPGIIVAPFGQEQIEQATNASDDITYPVLVSILEAANQAQLTGLNQRLVWRECIIDHFLHNRLQFDVGTQPFDQEVEPLAIVDPNAWGERQLYVSALVVRCKVRKTRRAK